MWCLAGANAPAEKVKAMRYLLATLVSFAIGAMFFAVVMFIIARFGVSPLGELLFEMQRGVSAIKAGPVMEKFIEGYRVLMLVIWPSTFFVVGIVATLFVNSRLMVLILLLCVLSIYGLLYEANGIYTASAAISVMLITSSKYISSRVKAYFQRQGARVNKSTGVSP